MTDARMDKPGDSGLAASGFGDSAVGVRLNALLASAGLEPLDEATAGQFASYLALLLKWNSKINLTAVRDEEGILARHFVESIACARALPAGIESLLDFGSGAGLPGIPIALCRPEMRVTLAESQGKKAAFLREAVRVLGIEARVHAGRAEDLADRFDCVAMRAVDRMGEEIRVALGLLRAGGWLVVMTTGKESERVKTAAGRGFRWEEALTLPGGKDRMLVMGALCRT
jgi:16S rRNA (guanine527-N7)-methyltransferase